MDGFKRKLIMQSLQYKLSAWLCVAIVAVALAGGAFSFATAFEEANELQDDQLRQVAALIHGHVVPLSPKKSQDIVLDADPEFRVVVQIIDASGIEVLSADQPLLAMPADVTEGIQTITALGEQWRIFVKTLDTQQRVVVAQQIEVRDEVAQESAIATLIPFVVLIPVLLLLVSYLIREMFKPVTKLATDLDQRGEQDLRAIDETNLPSEIAPFVVAINRMLARVDQSVALQQRFVADAAHEMRTPITALSLQAERLDAADMSEQARERLTKLKNGLKRTSFLLNQLLALARAQQENSEEKADVSVQHVFRSVLEDLMPLAQEKQIDIGAVSDLDAYLSVQKLDLVALVRNLLDNAIRYTPKGGKIDLSLVSIDGKLNMIVEDTGPGIPVTERERVFDAFYRVPGSDEDGSGLGLSIVKICAARMGAEIRLSDASASTENPGLRVTVVFLNMQSTFATAGTSK